VSAREWRAVREGETHAATKTSTNNTQESFIVGVGASGALLASAAIVFVTLVGLVSFNVWPTGRDVTAGVNVELSTEATPGSGSPAGGAAPVSAASGQVASTSVGTGSGVSGGPGGGGGDQGGGRVGHPKSGVTAPPTTTTTPPSTDGTGDSGDDGGPGPSIPGAASKDPAHPVHPAHPDTPHQNLSDGGNGKDDGTGNESDEVVTGKGPFSKPTVPPSSNSSTDNDNGNGTSKGHGSSRFKH
jgi:hypothetical protein